jgi:predicted lactoylglutathione lyase
MKIPRMTVITLGVADLARATKFYEAVLATPPDTSNDGVVFFPMPGVWLSLFPIANLAKDISPNVNPARGGFSGVTLAHNALSKAEVEAILARAKAAGACIEKEAQDTFWGGYGGYFSDPDGHYWEVVWGPMFEFTSAGDLKFKPAG